MTNIFSENDLEILIATKNRSNLDFLDLMFPQESFFNFNILIINQSEKNILLSNYEKVRVININERGLSRSRNLAIKNASKKICLIADDDVVYFSNFQNQIISTFNQNPEATIITFNHKREGLADPQNATKFMFEHNLKSIWKVCSIEVAFQLKAIKEYTIYFDENFGLGSYFESASEYVFLLGAIKRKTRMLFCPLVIVSHPLISSGEDQGSDRVLFARAALFYKTRSNLVYIWLLKYVFFLVRNGYINWNECWRKYKIGLSGIQKYKKLVELK